MPTEKYRLCVTWDDDERERLDELAVQLRLPRADLLRRLVMNYRMPRAEEFEAWQAIRDLLKVNADQARLGNLLKMIADDVPEDMAERFEELQTTITGTQDELKAVVHEIRASIPGR